MEEMHLNWLGRHKMEISDWLRDGKGYPDGKQLGAIGYLWPNQKPNKWLG